MCMERRQAMVEWISVKDKLPEDNRLPDDRVSSFEWYIVAVRRPDILSDSGYKMVSATALYDYTQKMWTIDWGEFKEKLNALINIEDASPDRNFVTHWMSMPEPPKENGNG